jgi:hypothetical protein
MHYHEYPLEGENSPHKSFIYYSFRLIATASYSVADTCHEGQGSSCWRMPTGRLQTWGRDPTISGLVCQPDHSSRRC